MIDDEQTPDEALTPDEELRAENEIESMKLEMDFGAHTFIEDDAPPEIIQTFLQNVRSFEENNKDHKGLTLREHLGEIEIKDVRSMTEEEAETAIEAFLQLLQDNSVVIDRPKHLTARGYYHFLTTDLLDQTLFAAPAPGMINGMIYSEIRQDEPEFMEQYTQEAVEDVLNFNRPYLGQWLAEECRSDPNYVPKSEILLKVMEWRQQYTSIIPGAFSLDEKMIKDGYFYQTFLVRWTGVKPDGTHDEWEGVGIAQLIIKDHKFQVEGIEMPGFRF